MEIQNLEKEKEIWKDILEYKGYYQVSNLGRVKAIGAFIKHDGNFNGGYYKKVKIRKQRIDKDGYCLIKLCKNGKCKTQKVHRLVAKAFLENPHNYPQVNHIDGNKENNNILNLEFCSAAYNMKHAWDTGLKNNEYLRGEGSPHAKTNENDVREMRRLFKDEGYTRKQLVEKFGLSSSMVRDIIANKTWQYVI